MRFKEQKMQVNDIRKPYYDLSDAIIEFGDLKTVNSDRKLRDSSYTTSPQLHMAPSNRRGSV